MGTEVTRRFSAFPLLYLCLTSVHVVPLEDDEKTDVQSFLHCTAKMVVQHFLSKASNKTKYKHKELIHVFTMLWRDTLNKPS